MPACFLWRNNPNRAQTSTFYIYRSHTLKTTTLMAPSEQVISSFLAQHTTTTNDEHPWLERDSNTRSQQLSRRRLTPQTDRLDSALFVAFFLVTKHPRSQWEWLTWWQTENGWLTSLQAKVLTPSPCIIQSANLQIVQITLLCHISLLQNSGKSRQDRRYNNSGHPRGGAAFSYSLFFF